MRHLLDKTYRGSAWIAAFSILAIALLVSSQVLLNIATRVFNLPLPSSIPSYADFAGFLLAAATFLAMPYTFRTGGHIKVSLITARLPTPMQLGAEVVSLGLAAFLTGFTCLYVVKLIIESWHFNDLSNGTIAVPLWIPQCTMAIGMVLLFISIIDALVQTVATRTAVIPNSEDI
jgi:TRAP-type C4-dicarboxylate transport system permease small subunit